MDVGDNRAAAEPQREFQLSPGQVQHPLDT